MFFLQFIVYSSSFVGTLVKNEIPEAALELCQLNINQLSPDILKFRTKHEDNQDNPFTLTVLWFLAAFCLYLMQARVDWVPIIFGTQVIKKKWPVLGPCFQTIFPFLMTMIEAKNRDIKKRCEICSERRHIRRSPVFILNFEHISHLFLMFP